MTRRTLPIGMQTFRKIREEDCYYVDKAAWIRRLLDEGKHYFLSRPRRFGKSLLLDTCKELFEGNEALFEGLAIHEHWDWSERHPVVRLDFGSGHFQGPGELRTEVTDRLRAMEDEAGITTHPDSVSGRFGHVLKSLHCPPKRGSSMVHDTSRQTANSIRLEELLAANDFAGLKTLFQAFYASIPYEWYTNNDIARFEGYCASVFYSYFAGLGLDITVEDSTSHGRLDMAVVFNENVYLFELKVVEMAPQGAAMAQLKERRYADKYRHLGHPIHLVAVEFSRDSRNVVAFEVEPG